MEIISKELTKEECIEFHNKVKELDNMYCDMLEELKHKNVFKAHCDRCGASFLFSYVDVPTYTNTRVGCPVCDNSITISSSALNIKYKEFKVEAKNNEEYVRRKAELTDFAKKHNIFVSFTD